jgi:tetratricopeptide (TPR) repeat protein
MKFPLILILCILMVICLPAGAADRLTATFSTGPGTNEIPPQNASEFITEAKDAIAGQNWSGALLITTTGIAWYPDNADLLCQQGYTYRKMGQYAKSVEVVSKAVPLDPTPVRYANRGYGYLALGNNTAALADAETGISKNPAYTTNYAVKALALQGMGRNTEALAAIGQALAYDPESAHYWHVKGVILAESGNCTGAREALERALAIDPGYSLPYPGFDGARERLAALNQSCAAPVSAQVPVLPQPTKSSSGGVAVIGVIGALVAIGMRR